MRIRLIAAALFAAGAALAEEVPQGLGGEAEAGLLLTSGNADTESVHAKLALRYRRGRLGNLARLEGMRSGGAQGVTAERYQVEDKLDYAYGPRAYSFASLAYEDDRFSGYAYRASAVLGYGRRFVPGAALKLAAELGLGGRWSRPEAGGREAEAVALGRGELEWTLSPGARFSQVLSVEGGADATITRAVTALTSQVAGGLAMKASFRLKHTSRVPPGIEKTDTETAVTLVYGF